MKQSVRVFERLSIAVLALAVALPCAVARVPNMIIRDVHVVAAGADDDAVLVQVQIADEKLKLVSEDTIAAPDDVRILDGAQGYVLGRLVVGETPNFIILTEDPADNINVLLDTKLYASFAVSDGQLIRNTLSPIESGSGESVSEAEGALAGYVPPAFAFPTSYERGRAWNTWESKYINGVLISAVILDRQFWEQDTNSMSQFGDLDAEFERGTIRGFRFGLAGTINFDSPWTYTLGGATNAFDRGFETEEADDFQFFDVRLDIPLGESAQVSIGKQKEPISMERLMTLVELPTFERSASGDAMLPSRNWGIVFSGTAARGRVSLAGGVFNDWFVESGSADDNATQVVGRITWLPYLSEDEFSLLHLGLGVRHTNAKEGLRYRSRPEMGNAPVFVDTDLFSADASTLVSLEASWRSGPFWLLGEFTDNRIDFRTPSVTPVIGTSTGSTIMDTSFHGYHVEVGWALTGEMRPYMKRKGVFRGVPVARSVYRGGLGSWEIGMRYSSLDLSDGLIEGGEIVVLTVGLSWWLTNKFMAGINIKRSATDRFGVNGDVNSLITRFTLIL